MEGLRGGLFLDFLLGFSLLFGTVAAATNAADTTTLKAFHNYITDPHSKLANWKGEDPCGSKWNGVVCKKQAFGNEVQYVDELHVLRFGLEGFLAPELGDLTNITILDLMWNNISGSIPSTLGKLQTLQILVLSGNQLTGQLPMELGRLTNLNRLHIDENQISGPIPPTFGNLSRVKHLHMNNNSLSGSIPPDLGRLPRLKHLLVDNNQLRGVLPFELANISTMEIIQVDNNQFEPQEIPPAYANHPSLLKLSMRNCNLYGSVLNFSSLEKLEYLDLSINHLFGMIPNGSISENLMAMILSNNALTGPIPASFGSLSKLQLLDFQNNELYGIDPSTLTAIQNSTELRVHGNPKICDAPAPQVSKFCSPQNSNIENSTSPANNSAVCKPDICQANQSLIPTLAAQGNCQCAPVIQIDCRLKSPGFVMFGKYLQDFEAYMSLGLNLSVGQTKVESFNWEAGPRLHFVLLVFPATSQAQPSFSAEEVQTIFLAFASWLIPESPIYGPRELLVFITPNGIDVFPAGGSTGRSRGAFAGIIVGSVAGTAILVGAVMFFALKRKVKPSPSRKHLMSSTHNKELKIEGLRCFSLEEMETATDHFSDAKLLGKGGFGNVYKGVLDIGEVAIKRANNKDMSEEGLSEFYTEIKLLSRVHHKNLVKLIGYCMDDGDQLLVYEYMAGGTLRDHLSSSERPLDLKTRLSIARGSAHGIVYLHNAADPPIIHRDIKAANILLDEKNEAKVSDFGVSRLAPVPDLDGLTPDHVSTVVKGTPGYLDPEYFLTRQLTDKSDVYSFGVVLLEIFSGKHPIFNGKNLVREIRMAYKKGNTMSLIDPNINYAPKEIEHLASVALSCCNDQPETRPSMAEVLRSLDNIWYQYSGSNWHSNESSVVDLDCNYTEEQRAQIFASLTDTTTSTFSTETTISNRDSTSSTQKRDLLKILSSR